MVDEQPANSAPNSNKVENFIKVFMVAAGWHRADCSVKVDLRGTTAEAAAALPMAVAAEQRSGWRFPFEAGLGEPWHCNSRPVHCISVEGR